MQELNVCTVAIISYSTVLGSVLLSEIGGKQGFLYNLAFLLIQNSKIRVRLNKKPTGAEKTRNGENAYEGNRHKSYCITG